MSSLEKELFLSKLPSRPPMPSGLQAGSKMKMGPGRKRDFSPVAWSHYFEAMEDIEIETSKDSFRIYKSGSDGPVLLLLHGGGHSALSWAVFTSMITNRVHCRVVAVDLRSHGDTKVKNSEDLSAETMSRDVGNIVETLYGANPPPILLIGHSMGGAIAVHTAAKNLVPSLLALCVIDVVEGTAMDALNSMQTFLRSRPKVFNSVENAIEWRSYFHAEGDWYALIRINFEFCAKAVANVNIPLKTLQKRVKSGQIRNLESARVSMVGQIKRCEDGINTPGSSQSIVDTAIHEEEEEAATEKEREPESSKKIKEDKPEYTWRIELSKTEKYWEGWFRGLSNLFLSCPVPKLLLLAGVDRLDRDLTIGQMQGKFQMQVLPQCGHAVHEDAPDKVAEAVATFMIRNKFTESKGEIQSTYPSF